MHFLSKESNKKQDMELTEVLSNYFFFFYISSNNYFFSFT